MKIEIDTKFDVGDEVWFMDGIRPTKGKIFEITIGECKIYHSDDCNFFDVLFKISIAYGTSSQYSDDVFATKRELIESLMDKGDKEE